MFLPFAGALGTPRPGSIEFNRAQADSIETTANVAAAGFGDLTIEGRFRTATNGELYLGGIGGNTSGGVVVQTTSGQQIRVVLSGLSYTYSSGISGGLVFDFALSRAGSTWRTFVNGALVGTQNLNFSVSSSKVIMGQKTTAGGDEFNGLISHIHVTRRVKYTAPYAPSFAPKPDDDTLALIHNPTGIAIEEANGLALTLNNSPTPVSTILA